MFAFNNNKMVAKKNNSTDQFNNNTGQNNGVYDNILQQQQQQQQQQLQQQQSIDTNLVQKHLLLDINYCKNAIIDFTNELNLSKQELISSKQELISLKQEIDQYKVNQIENYYKKEDFNTEFTMYKDEIAAINSNNIKNFLNVVNSTIFIDITELKQQINELQKE